MDRDIGTLDSQVMFHKMLLTFVKPSKKSIYNIYDPQESKLLNRLRLGFSHLHEIKFQHNFADTVNPLCSCVIATESKNHFFLCCKNYVSFRTTLMNKLISIDCQIVSLKLTTPLEVIIYGNKMLLDNYPNRPYFEY